jgi:hypothetical protein
MTLEEAFRIAQGPGATTLDPLANNAEWMAAHRASLAGTLDFANPYLTLYTPPPPPPTPTIDPETAAILAKAMAKAALVQQLATTTPPPPPPVWTPPPPPPLPEAIYTAQPLSLAPPTPLALASPSPEPAMFDDFLSGFGGDDFLFGGATDFGLGDFSFDLPEVFGQDSNIIEDVFDVMPDGVEFGLEEVIPDVFGEQMPIPDVGPIPDGMMQRLPQILQQAVGRPMIAPLGRAAAPRTGATAMPSTVPSIFSRGLTSAGGAVAGIVRTAAGKMRGVFTSAGRFVSSRKAVELAKKVGIDTAAVALGIGTVELAQMLLDDAGSKHKRGRGVTAAQMRTTRRTMTKIESMHRKIAGYCRDAGVGRTHRRAAPSQFVRVKKC